MNNEYGTVSFYNKKYKSNSFVKKKLKIEKIRIIVAYWPMITDKEMFYKNHRYALKKKNI